VKRTRDRSCMLLPRAARHFTCKRALSTNAGPMDGHRSPSRHPNPSAARALALIREAVQEAESRGRVSPSPIPSPTPSPRPSPNAQPAYPEAYHTGDGQGYRPQQGHIQLQGWRGTQHSPSLSPSLSPRAGAGPLSGGHHTAPTATQDAPQGRETLTWEWAAQQGPRNSASLGSSSRGLSPGRLGGGRAVPAVSAPTATLEPFWYRDRVTRGPG